MNSDYKGELRLADGTHVIKSDKWHLDLPAEHDSSLLPPADFGRWHESHLEGTGTITFADIDALLDLMPDHYLQPEICVYVSNHRYWQIEYARQGKWYPRPKKRKSQARMSRKWRGRA